MPFIDEITSLFSDALLNGTEACCVGLLDPPAMGTKCTTVAEVIVLTYSCHCTVDELGKFGVQLGWNRGSEGRPCRHTKKLLELLIISAGPLE